MLRLDRTRTFYFVNIDDTAVAVSDDDVALGVKVYLLKSSLKIDGAIFIRLKLLQLLYISLDRVALFAKMLVFHRRRLRKKQRHSQL